MCALASLHPTHAPSMMKDLMEELTLVDRPILIVMDSVNYWDAKSDFRDPQKDGKLALPCHRLELVREWSKFLKKAPKNGVVVWSVTGSFTLKFQKNYLRLCHKLYEVLPYSGYELKRVLDHYALHDFIKFSPPGSRQGSHGLVGLCKGLTDGVGKEVFRYLGMRKN